MQPLPSLPQIAAASDAESDTWVRPLPLSPPPTPHLRRWGWGYGGMEERGGAQGRNTTPLNHSLRYINFPSCNLELCNITLHYNRWTTWRAGSGHIFHVKTTFIIRLTYFSPAGRRPTFKYMCEEEKNTYIQDGRLAEVSSG